MGKKRSVIKMGANPTGTFYTFTRCVVKVRDSAAELWGLVLDLGNSRLREKRDRGGFTEGDSSDCRDINLQYLPPLKTASMLHRNHSAPYS